MNTQPQPQQQLSPIAKFRLQIADQVGEFARVLPPSISAEAFARVIITAVQNKPELLHCDRQTLFAACMKAAEDGLLPDGREGVLNKYRTKGIVRFRRDDGSVGEREDYIMAAQWLPMVEGVRKLLWNAGIMLQVRVVYEGDKFEYQEGDYPQIAHTPLPHLRSKELKAVYSIARDRDTGRIIDRDLMWREEIEQVRKEYGGEKNQAWAKDASYQEMAIKTVVHHHSKSLPSASEIRQVVNRPEFWNTSAQDTEETASLNRIDQVINAAGSSPALAAPSAHQQPMEYAAPRTVEGAMAVINGAGAETAEQQATRRKRRTKAEMEAARAAEAAGKATVAASGGGGGSNESAGVSGGNGASRMVELDHATGTIREIGGGGGSAYDAREDSDQHDAEEGGFDPETGEVIEEPAATETSPWDQPQAQQVQTTHEAATAEEFLAQIRQSSPPANRGEYLGFVLAKWEQSVGTPFKEEAVRKWWTETGGMRTQLGVTQQDAVDLANQMRRPS